MNIRVSPGSFISCDAAWSFVGDVQDVANDIGKIIKREPERAAHLFETFIAACHEKAEEIDGSGGRFGMLVDDLFRGLIDARQTANHDPDETARLLISWLAQNNS
jgi:hypothetical protein